MQTHTFSDRSYILLAFLLWLFRQPIYAEETDSLSFHLPDVIVTAVHSKAPGSISLLPATAIEHVQSISAADLMQLLPGGLTGNFGGPRYFTVREINFRNGGNRTSTSIAEGMQIVLDGSPLHHNADISSPYNGMDTRFLSMNEIQQAEVIRGIPSAQYGNLTNGLLKLKTRTGQMPLTVGIRYTPSLKQYTAGKGFAISPLGHTLNLLADYTAQKIFHTGGLRIANQYQWQPSGTPLLLNLSYTGRFGGEKVFVSEDKQSWQQRQEHRFALGSEWKPGRKLLQSLSLRFDLSATKSNSYKYDINSNPKQMATDAMQSGEWLATVLPNNYHCERFTEDLPLYAEAEVIASTRLPLATKDTETGGQVELKAGASWRSEGNRGKGIDFDVMLPPGEGSRPVSYSDIPFLHEGVLFVESLFRWPKLTVQAGIRYQTMMSRDYPLMSSAEPRLNLSWMAFSSPRYALRLKAGAGLLGQMPRVGMLYPEAIYDDRISFSYNDPERGYALGVVTVHAPGTIQNKALSPTLNRKIEGGLSLEAPAVNLDATFFYEHQTGGFAYTTDYLPFSYRKYDYLYEEGLRPEYKNGQVMVDGQPVPYREQTEFTTINLPVNATVCRKQGVELTADFGTFQPLRTSFIADGRWLRIRRNNTVLSGHKESYDVDGVEYPLAGFYDKTSGQSGNETVTEQITSNFRFITRIPQIGLVTTLTLQMVWMDKSYIRYNGGTATEVWPLYWSEGDGVRHPFTDTEREDPRFALLMQQADAYAFDRNSYKPYGMFNLRASKEFTRYITLSFFVNNLADMRPSRYSDSARGYYRQNAEPFFGIEMQVKL